jgi:hypothetical protein
VGEPNPTTGNAHRVLRAIITLGATWLDLTLTDLASKGIAFHDSCCAHSYRHHHFDRQSCICRRMASTNDDLLWKCRCGSPFAQAPRRQQTASGRLQVFADVESRGHLQD